MGRPAKALMASKPKSNMDFDDFSLPFGLSHSGRQMHDRIVYLSGDVTEHSISHVIMQLISLANADAHKPIYLIISTYGGSVDEMFSLFDTVKMLQCPVVTVGLGKVMSAGVLLLASGTKGKRMIGAHARIMIHPVRGGAIGNPLEFANETKEITRLQDAMKDLMVNETKLTRPQVEEIMASGYDKYFTAKEALEMGIVDKIIKEKK